MKIKPRMDVEVIGEYGHDQALLGLGLSFGLTSGMSYNDLMKDYMFGKNEKIIRIIKTAHKLAGKDGGHNKFLESIQLWLDINAPRYWWSEFDTYRVGTSKQSASTMHTLVKDMSSMAEVATAYRAGTSKNLESMKKFSDYYKKNFEFADRPTSSTQARSFAIKVLELCNIDDPTERLLYAKGTLTENFLQRRVVSLNYKVMRNIIQQRYNHRLPHWKMFIDCVLEQVEQPKLLEVKNGK